jgi:hypothetical protein
MPSVMPASGRRRTRYDELEESAGAAWSAVQNCDMSFLRAAILSQSEFASVTAKTPPDVTAYQNMVDEWLKKEVQEFCTPPPDGTYRYFGGLQIQNVAFLPAGSQWKRAVAIGFVTAYVCAARKFLPDDHKRIGPMMLLDFEGRWRILVQK